MTEDDRAALRAATDAVRDAPDGERRDARARRAELICDIARRTRAGRYPNRWTSVIGPIAELTGMSRSQVSAIVNNTPTPSGAQLRAQREAGPDDS